MNSTKKPPFPRGTPSPFKQPLKPAPQAAKPPVVQPKRLVAAPRIGRMAPQIITRPPVTPPASRTLAPAKVAQTKPLNRVVNPKPPFTPKPPVTPAPRVAPPAYRPQPPPRVLQTKSAPAQRPQVSQPLRQPFALAQVPRQQRVAVQAHTLKSVGQQGPANTVQRTIGHIPGAGSVIQSAPNKTAGRKKKPQPAKGGRRQAPVKKTRSFKGRTTTKTKRVTASKAAASKAKKKPQKQAAVTLWINNKDYKAVSSGQFGHAEMAALKQFVDKFREGATSRKEVYSKAWAVLKGASKEVSCPNQPVCGSCSMILRALGFDTIGTTEFSTKKSGGVAWGANLELEAFLNHIAKNAKSKADREKFTGLYTRARTAGMK